MHFHKSYKLGPTTTPLIIKIILGLIISISVLSSLINPFFKNHYIAYFLGLSLSGIKHFFIWQFITYNFLQPGYGININFIISLLFNLYLIWIIGASVIERISQVQFIIFYVLCSIFSAFVMLLIMSVGYPHFIYAEPTISLYAILIAWMMLNPADTRIFLFFTLPMKHYWLVLGLIGFNLLTSLSNMQMVNFFGYLAVSIFAYFYSVIIWNRHSPFHHFHKMEKALIYTCKPIIERIKKRKFH